jgi:hypothetical protein
MPDSVNYRGFPQGVDNRRASFDVPRSRLRDGVNVDVLTANGKVRMRRGLRQAIADPDAHSGFSDGLRIIWATKTQLKLAGPNLVPKVLLTDPRLSVPLSCVPLHGEIYFSNEYINGKVNVLDLYEPWGITPPAAAPVLTAPTGDKFVQVTCAFVAASKEISGAPLAAVVACTCDPVIQVSSIPQSTDSRVVSTRLYVTGIDGTEFFAEVDVPAGTTTFTLRGKFGKGERLNTQFMQPPPPGQLLEYLNGRIYIGRGPLVLQTEPLRYGVYDPEADYLMYPERVTLLKGVEDGMYTSADRTYFEGGIGTPDLSHSPVLPYRAIEGAACNLPNSKDVMWFSERGFVRGAASGAVKNLTEGQVAVSAYARACLGIVENDGHKAVIAIAKDDGRPSPLVARDYVAADATRATEIE